MKKCFKQLVVLFLMFIFFCPSFSFFATNGDLSVSNCRLSDLSVFSDLRRAVLENDEAGVAKFSRYSGFSEITPGFVPQTVESARRFLDVMDKKYILSFQDHSIEFDSTEYSIDFNPYTVITVYELSEWRIMAYNYLNTGYVEIPTVAFSLETEDGNFVDFYETSGKGVYRGFYPVNSEDNYGMDILISRRDKDTDTLPPIDKLGKLSAVTFEDLTQPAESVSWLWIALPVGAVVIAGGAAFFLLLRKKRRTEN